jgi:hypothetical protein
MRGRLEVDQGGEARVHALVFRELVKEPNGGLPLQKPVAN